MVSVMEAALKPNVVPKILNLRNNFVGDYGAISRDTTLKVNIALWSLNLADRDIGDSGT